MRLIITIGAVTCIVIVSQAPRLRDVFSWMLNKLAELPEMYPETLRSRFVDEEMVDVKSHPHHTHGASAASRSTGSLFIEQFAKGLARSVLFYQCSRADQRNQRLGSRSYFWAKDLTVAPTVFQPAKGDFLAMVDVDQYVDLTEFCVDNFQPLILYTFQPGSVAKHNGEYSYTFNSNNQVVYRVSGGAEYVHEVWNFNSDSLVICKKFLGIPYRTAAYLVDKRGVDDDHQLILLTPLSRWTGPMAILATYLAGPMLEKFQPVIGDFLRMEKHDKTGVTIHTGRVGEYISACVPADVDSYLASITRTSKVGLTLPQVKSKMEDQNGSAILFEYHVSKLQGRTPLTFPVEKYVRGYQFYPDKYEPGSKQSMQAFMNPIIDGAFCPEMCKNNNQAAIAGRIEKVRSVAGLDKFIITAVDEFVEMLFCGRRHFLVPLEPEKVYEKQNKPTQKRILKEAEFSEAVRIGKAFMKREAYAKCNDPRIITTINGRDKLDYSQFTYALSDYMKNVFWYMVGKKPREIADEIAALCEEAQVDVSNTDFSRMDGHWTEAGRYLIKQVFLVGFNKRYTQELVELMRAMYNMIGYMTAPTGDVVKYDQQYALSSGAPDTSLNNTILNAFIAFLSFRMTRVNGLYLTAAQSWARLGRYLGDDGLTADVQPQTYRKAARRMGQELDIQPVPRGMIGVKFLSRCYGPDVWYGNPNSMTDIKRTLSKFHVTVHLPHTVSAFDKMLDKSFAYWLTDENTPILGDFVSKACEFRSSEFTNICGSWNAKYPKEEQYYNQPQDWYMDFVLSELPDFNHSKFDAWIRSVKNVHDLLHCPPCHDRLVPSTKQPVVVDDDVSIPTDTSTGSSSETPVRRTRKRTRKQRSS